MADMPCRGHILPRVHLQVHILNDSKLGANNEVQSTYAGDLNHKKTPIKTVQFSKLKSITTNKMWAPTLYQAKCTQVSFLNDQYFSQARTNAHGNGEREIRGRSIETLATWASLPKLCPWSWPPLPQQGIPPQAAPHQRSHGKSSTTDLIGNLGKMKLQSDALNSHTCVPGRRTYTKEDEG